jgi:hypothetical protein
MFSIIFDLYSIEKDDDQSIPRGLKIGPAQGQIRPGGNWTLDTFILNGHLILSRYWAYILPTGDCGPKEISTHEILGFPQQ